MKFTAFIFARYGSKGLPKKNIKLLGGKPLIGWAIEQAFASRGINRVIVSTDSEEIASVARLYGAETPFIRPKNLAQDDSPEWLSWRHALEFLKSTEGKYPEALVSIPTTSPLRIPLDIENSLLEYEKGDADVILSVTDSHRNPFFNMIKINNNGFANLVNDFDVRLYRRQDMPKVYDVTTVCYVINSEFILSNNSIFEGRVKSVWVPKERAIDIDTLMDFQIAEHLLNIKEGSTL